MSDKITPLLTPDQARGLIEQLGAAFPISIDLVKSIVRANTLSVPKFRVGQVVSAQNGEWYGRVKEILSNDEGVPCYPLQGKVGIWAEYSLRAITPEEIAGPEGELGKD